MTPAPTKGQPLAVTFWHGEAEVERRICDDGREAARQAILLIARRKELRAGDALRVIALRQ